MVRFLESNETRALLETGSCRVTILPKDRDCNHPDIGDRVDLLIDNSSRGRRIPAILEKDEEGPSGTQISTYKKAGDIYTLDGLAHFEICSCGQHGRVVFPDGRTGGEMASKEESIYLLQYAMLVDKFQGVDIFPEGKLGQIEAEIEASAIPASKKLAGEYFRKQINTWNTSKLHQPNFNPADFP